MGAAELIRMCLQKKSFDNMTVLIAHFVDGSDWECRPDEVLDYEALAIGAVPPGDSRHQHLAFLHRVGSPSTPAPGSDGRWLLPDNGTAGGSSSSLSAATPSTSAVIKVSPATSADAVEDAAAE